MTGGAGSGSGIRALKQNNFEVIPVPRTDAFDAWTVCLVARGVHEAREQVELRPSLKDQLIRAAESIVLNLAEGSARPTPKDRARFYAMSLASFREAQAALQLAGQTPLITRFDHLGACLYRLSRARQ